MRTNLDDLLAAWRERRAQVELNQIEPRVWAAIGSGRAPDVAGLLSVRAAFVASIMVAGAAAGAAAGAQPVESSPFSLHPPYAPSTLLEGKP